MCQVISTEWTLHKDVCHQLWQLWGYPTVDLFATRLKYRLPNFVSPFQDPAAIATDAFLYNWDNQDLYAFPPFPLIRKVLNKLRSSGDHSFWVQNGAIRMSLVFLDERSLLRTFLMRGKGGKA